MPHVTDPSSTPPNPTPSPPPGSGSAHANRDRELIAAARAQATSPPLPPLLRSPSWTPARVDLPEDFFPGYQIVREIHRGGQGVVYQAIQKATKRKLALKMLREGPLTGSPRDRSRFEREIEILAQLNHPNIVSVIDSGQVAGASYYVMDYISGVPLDAWMSQPRSIEETLRVFAKICDAVNAAHLKGIIHRDLKPSNIKIDAEGEPHILDFGLAKLATGDIADSSRLQLMSMTGQFIGSLPWASPEQAEGAPDKIDLRTDVYSLGVVLYQMLTGGKFPYNVIGNMRDVLDNILRAEPARPSTIRRQINDEVETIVLKCLSKERERRYQSAGELGRDVRNYLSGQPIEAKRDSGWYLLNKTIRRHRLAAGTAAGVLVLLVAFAASMTFMYTRATRAEADARKAGADLRVALAGEQEQRARAEANLQSVLDLSRVFMDDFHQRIRDLRGATPAREALLVAAQDHLRRVAPQAEGNADLQRALADAYGLVGELQGALSEANLGQSDQAAESFAEEQRLRAELVQAHPGNGRYLADLARSETRAAQLLRAKRDFDGARAAFNAAVDRYDKALALLPPDDEAHRDIEDRRIFAKTLAAQTLLLAAGAAPDDFARANLVEAARAANADAEAHWLARSNENPADARAARLYNEARVQSAELLLAEAARRRRLVEQQARSGADAISSVMEALSLLDQGLAMLSASLDALDAFRAANPADARIERRVFYVHWRIGQVHREAGELLEWIESSGNSPPANATASPATSQARHEAALASFQTALDIASRLASSDESNLGARRDLSLCELDTARQFRRLQRLDEAAPHYEHALKLRRELAATDPVARHRNDLGVGLLHAADAALARSDSQQDPARRRELLAAARDLASEAAEVFSTLVSENRMRADAREIEQAARILGECDRKLAPAPP